LCRVRRNILINHSVTREMLSAIFRALGAR
jgi:hypothetical protein